MKYDIVKMVGDEHIRYSLTNKGDNPLIVFGINPSTADKGKPDPTMRRVMGFAERYGFDSFVMLNVYPLRATNPAALPQECDAALHTANIQEIVNVVSSHPEASILMAYGGNINIRKYLRPCLRDIVEAIKQYSPKYYQIGTALNLDGSPKHPLMAPYSSTMTPCDINKQINV